MPESSAFSSARPDTLWAVVSDLTLWPDLLPTFTSIRQVGGPPAIGVGSRFEVRQPGVVTSIYEITEWKPGASFTWVARSPGVVTTAHHLISEIDGGSRLDLEFTWSGPLGRLATPVFRRKAQSMIELEAATFARVAEG